MSIEMKKIISWVLLITLLVSSNHFFQTTIYASELGHDVVGHWAEETIMEFIDLSYMKGYEDGSFKPDQSITRAEFVTLTNSVFGYTVMSKGMDNFNDISDSDWFANEVMVAKAAGYISGYSDGSFKPNENISREEVCVILSNIKQLDTSDDTGIDKFSDSEAISDWSKKHVSAVASSGYVNGYPDGSFKPQQSITRAESVTVLSLLLNGKSYAYNNIEVATVYNESGTYGPETGMEEFVGNVYINAQDITLRNMIITGKLILGEDIGDGDITIDHVTVNGETIIQGGGENSVTIKNSSLDNVLVVRIDGIVRVLAVGTTNMGDVSVEGAGAILKEHSLYGEGFENIEVLGTIQEGSEVVIDAEIDELSIGALVDVEVTGGSAVGEIIVQENGDGSTIDVSSTSEVDEITFEGSAKVNGSGTIDKIIINCEGVEVEQEVSTITIDDSVSGATVGGEIVEESTAAPVMVIPIAPSSGGSSSEDSESGDSGTGNGSEGGIDNNTDNNDTTAPTVTFVPDDGTANVSTSSVIKIYFNEAVRNLDDSELVNMDLLGIITLKKDDENGDDVAYNGVIADDEKSVTITPSQNFDYSQDYYVLVEAKLEDEANNSISESTIIFTTEENPDPAPVVSFEPQDGAVDITTSSVIKISFSEAVRNLDDGELLSTDLDNIVFLNKTDENGEHITYSGVVADDKKSITITPSQNLEYNQDYYVYVANQLEDSNDNRTTSASAIFTTERDPLKKGITFLVYLDGDNNLEAAALEDVNEMVNGVTDDVNVVVLIDRISGYSTSAGDFGEDFTDTRLYEITPGTATRIYDGGEEFPDFKNDGQGVELNMGDAETLKKFVKFGKANYYSDKYVLILWNHGSGVRGSSGSSETTSSMKAICGDVTSNDDYMYTAEITDVLTSNESVDIIGFDACLMGSVEVAYQYSGISEGAFKADYMVASGPTEYNDGWEYKNILERFSSLGGENGTIDLTMGGNEVIYDPYTVSLAEIGGVIVEEQRDSTVDESDQSLSCYDLSKVKGVKSAVDDLAIELYNASVTNAGIRTNFEAIRGGYGRSTDVMYYFDHRNKDNWINYPFLDIYDLCNKMTSNNFTEEIMISRENVLNAVDEMIVWSFANSYFDGFVEGENGISIFFSEGDYEYKWAPLWKEHWWYSPLDTTITFNSTYLYGKLQWCIDDNSEDDGIIGSGDGEVTNWFELLDAWYDVPNSGTGGYNGYEW